MGWLFAVIFGGLAAVFALFLFLHWEDRRSAVAQLQLASVRLQDLERQGIAVETLQKERDALASTLLALRNEGKEIAHAKQEHIRIVSKATEYAARFNAQIAEAKGKWEQRQRKADEEAARQEKEITERLADQQRRFAEETRSLEAEIADLRVEHQQFLDESNLRHMGFYEARYNYTTSVAYQTALDANLAQQKALVKNKTAASCARQWSIGGSLAEGKKQADRILTLMLRAFNGECDSAIARVRATNYQAMEMRISKAFASVNKLGEGHACEVGVGYLELKIEELRLSHEHAMKIQAEREQQREVKDQMRQEAIAARELEKAMQEAEADEHRRQVALESARQELAQAAREQQSVERQAELEAKLHEMEEQLVEAHAARERAISRAQETKSGHVYVISNIGSFGDGIYKIGMTRRLDPMDRIWELSDASVPFDFDVHAIIYTDDAPGLENELHRRFADRRLNVVNQRKEFFHASIHEIAQVVRQRCGDIELTLIAEASEFLQSEAHRRHNGLPLLANRQIANGTGAET